MRWKAKLIKHRGERRIAMQLLETGFSNKISLLDGAKWSNSRKLWHLPDTPENRKKYEIDAEIFDSNQFVHQSHYDLFEKWLKSKRYSPSTVKTYLDALKVFLHFFRAKQVSLITNDDIVDFTNQRILNRGLSPSYQNQFVNAVKLFFTVIDERKIEIDKIHRPRREKLLPNVLSKKEVKSILEVHSNIKHRTMLSLIYSCGLRRGELIRLKPADIDANRNIIIIRQAKGKKDRIVPLSPKILELLRSYYQFYKPKVWLFEGQTEAMPYDERSLSNVLKLAVQKCGINKPVSLHWLRHSYATHLLEAGTDLRYIQEILGHNSSRTTEIYTHVSTQSIQHVKSPYDDL